MRPTAANSLIAKLASTEVSVQVTDIQTHLAQLYLPYVDKDKLNIGQLI
jgi:hypothetical protein